jgi:hypothetical protein
VAGIPPEPPVSPVEESLPASVSVLFFEPLLEHAVPRAIPATTAAADFT